MYPSERLETSYSSYNYWLSKFQSAAEVPMTSRPVYIRWCGGQRGQEEEEDDDMFHG